MMMTPSEFAQRLSGACGVKRGSHVLAAVSGGADSVALLCLLDETREMLGISVSCAHVEHGIRGEASLEDMRFVQMLCMQKSIPFYARQVDVPGYAKAHAIGLEEAARTLRRAALTEIAAECGAEVIALAHHAMDQAETVLLHAARGSDVRGLCAMRERSGQMIRPLLYTPPQALRDYLEKTGQTWREDETNRDVAFARNRMRHEALPALERAYPGAVLALCRLAMAAQRDETYFERKLDEAGVKPRRLVNGAAFEREQLAALEDVLLGRLLVRTLEAHGFGAQAADMIERIAAAVRSGEEATVNLTGGAHAYVGARYVCLVRAQEPVRDTPIALDGETKTPFGTFSVRPAGEVETGDGLYSQAFDEEVLCGAVVSGRREGDKMTPFGRETPVKLKKLMIDAGVERPIRDSLPVIRRGEDGTEILWAVGLRPSQRCAAHGGRRLMLEYKGNDYNA